MWMLLEQNSSWRQGGQPKPVNLPQDLGEQCLRYCDLCNSASQPRAVSTGRQGVMRRREILAAASLFLMERVRPMTGLVML